MTPFNTSSTAHRAALPAPVWRPDPRIAATCQVATFADALSLATSQDLREPQALHAWSVAHWREFWRFAARWWREPLQLAGDDTVACEGEACETARFFPGLRLNYADSLLGPQVAPDDAPALWHWQAASAGRRWTRGQLRQQVARVADALRAQGIGEGDRVVAVMRNDDSAVVAALAVAALGATLSTAAPDMGEDAVVDRFAPLSPRLLLAHTAAREGDAGTPLAPRVQAIATRLPTLQRLVRLDGEPLATPLPQQALDELAAAGDASRFEWRRFPFNHPLFILFSSGTTGRPKCIVHGAGGSLLEHVKEHRLHTDLRPGDRMYFHTSCGWMMWQWQLSALASGVELVTYDGPLDTVDRLWRLAAGAGVTVLGTSPAYLRLCEEAGLHPGRDLALGGLRALLSTGAVLPEGAYHWVRRCVGPVQVQSICGGTDILGCFVLGDPRRPVHAGQAQALSLGLDVQAWQDGHAAPGVGELVCANPFPSRPLGLHGDADGSRLHAAWFARHPGVWTHGDLIELTPEGGARLHGRCDGVINVRGIKVSPAEIYRVLEDEPELAAALVVPRELPHAEGRPSQEVVALLQLRAGQALDGALVARLRRLVMRRLSAAHVPDRFLAVPELPATHSGKLSEAAARSAVTGQPVANEGALRNPGCLAAIREHPGLRDESGDDATGDAGSPALASPQAMASGQAMASPPSMASPQSLAEGLRPLWERALGLSPVSLDDNFFDLGGNSVLAAALLARVRRLTGHALPLAALWQAPTVRAQAELIAAQAGEPGRAGGPGDAGAVTGAPTLACLRAGSGSPLFLVHGLSGTVMECWPLVRALRSPRPVWGVQAVGLDGEAPPQQRVEDMASRYLQELRAVQPQGPYAICGFSFGALVALEMARQLAEAGEHVAPLCLLDPVVHQDLPRPRRAWERLRRVALTVASQPAARRWPWLRASLARVLRSPGSLVAADGMSLPQAWSQLAPGQRRVYQGLREALQAYAPRAYDGGPVCLVRARLGLEGFFDALPVWRRLLRGGLQVHTVPGGHLGLVGEQSARVAALLDQALGLPPEEAAAGGNRPRGTRRPTLAARA